MRKIKNQSAKEFLEDLEKEIKKASKNAEPLIKKTRKVLIKLGKAAEIEAKKAYKRMKK